MLIQRHGKSKDSFFNLLPFFLARMSLSHSNPLHGTVATECKQQSDYGESEWPFEEQARHANMMPRWNIMLISVRICHLPCWAFSDGVGSGRGGASTCKSKSKAHAATMWWDDEFYHTKAQIIWIKRAETAMRSCIVNLVTKHWDSRPSTSMSI